MAVVTFGRTESWTSGWRGRQNSTPIRVDGEEVGQIRGEEVAIGMLYTARIGRETVTSDTLADCKRSVKAALSR